MTNKASADPREPHWLLLPGCSRDAVMALTQPNLTAEERERLANDLFEADSYESLSARAKEGFDRAHERHVWHLGFAPAGERLHGGACEQSCRTLADVRATLAECQGARGMRVDGAGRRTHEVRVDWEKTVLDADVLCPDCGSLTHHHGVFPDLVLQCSICGGWYSADAGLYLGDEVRVIVRGYRLRKHARIAWMLEEAIRDREAEPGNEDYRDELRERSATEFADEGELCAHLLTKRSCHICGLKEQLRGARGNVARLESERPCVTCRTHLVFPELCRDLSEESIAARVQRRRADVAEARAEAAVARVAALAAEVKRLLAAGAGGDRVMKPFEPGGESGG